ERIYLPPTALDARLPPAPISARILSPFDNVIIQRQRSQSLFGYDYQLECYLPEHKRRFGYFCLPILYRDRFVGRMDCKAHRKERRLEIRRLFVEHPQWLLPDGERGIAALATALAAFAVANRCPLVDLGEVVPADWQQPLSAACHQMEQPMS
ncbi:MAG: DNA glycosylase AlkZ-like family protein, partial [Pseudomonadales bacterium]